MRHPEAAGNAEEPLCGLTLNEFCVAGSHTANPNIAFRGGAAAILVKPREPLRAEIARVRALLFFAVGIAGLEHAHPPIEIRQPNRDRKSLAFGAFDRELAAVFADNPPDDEKP